MAPETPRGVSSRLLTMKFMQRAAASASSPGTPDSDTHSAKKRKLGHASPAESKFDASINQASIKAALEEQESKRQAALAQHSSSDTQWVLKNTLGSAQVNKSEKAPMKIVYVGYGDVDSSNESGDNEDEPQQGRTSTRNYKSGTKKTKAEPTRQQSNAPDDDNDEGSDSSSDSSSNRKRKTSGDSPDDSPDPRSTQTRSRSRSHSRHPAEGAKAKEFRDKRKKKEVRLNQLSSISASDGHFGSQSSPSGKPFTCYKCHQAGHKAVDCPKNGSRSLSMR